MHSVAYVVLRDGADGICRRRNGSWGGECLGGQEHTGLTTQPQPTLRFYISGSCPIDIEFALNEPYAKKSVLGMNIRGPFVKGIAHISLADYDITLRPGMTQLKAFPGRLTQIRIMIY
ncbi:MAG TPA: hypothetical protein ENK58_05835 [Desulfobacterales bacterium]|nr:MAG: hypothetical protein DRI57_26740 [Deltaproteobacteria bacterium]HHC24922.1 hypothetical protein [Desulfobacterales bacterium]